MGCQKTIHREGGNGCFLPTKCEETRNAILEYLYVIEASPRTIIGGKLLVLS